MLLELWCVLLGLLLGVFCILLFLLNDLVVFIVIFFRLWLGLRWCNEENIKSRLVAHGVAIEDIASVLAVILAESPPESLAKHFRWNLFLCRFIFEILVHSQFQVKYFKIIIRLSLILFKLLELLIVDLLTIG